MTKLEQMIQNKNNAATELVATTIRLTRETHSFVEDLAEELQCSKQDALDALIEAGIIVTKEKLDLSKPDDQPFDGRFLLLNTCKRFNSQSTAEMVNEGIAAAYYGPWKEHIDQIKKGD